MIDTPTPEQIAIHYSAAFDSVNLLNAGKPENMSEEEWTGCGMKFELDKNESRYNKQIEE